jgi:S-DNA-T family DNA segregation ATPase FtsK/SpoIIIE
VVEDIAGFAGTAAEARIADLIAVARRTRVPVIAEAEAETVTGPGAWQLFNELKTARAGIALQPDESDGVPLLRTHFPGATRAGFPPGRGILVAAGRAQRVHVAFPDPTGAPNEPGIRYARGARETATRGATSETQNGPTAAEPSSAQREPRAHPGRIGSLQ